MATQLVHRKVWLFFFKTVMVKTKQKSQQKNNQPLRWTSWLLSVSAHRIYHNGANGSIIKISSVHFPTFSSIFGMPVFVQISGKLVFSIQEFPMEKSSSALESPFARTGPFFLESRISTKKCANNVRPDFSTIVRGGRKIVGRFSDPHGQFSKNPAAHFLRIFSRKFEIPRKTALSGQLDPQVQ